MKKHQPEQMHALREVNGQAQGFERARKANRMEVAEDYVELIADLIECTGEARVVDIAERLGVTSATVNNTMQRLARDGLVLKQRYRSIFLTERGHMLARESKERHRLIVEFLICLGVDAATAEEDAEGMEHHVSKKTLGMFQVFLDRNKEKPGTGRNAGKAC